MALDEAQKDFIRKRVDELGSEEEVNLFYCNKDKVADFAKKVAKTLNLPKLHPKERKKFKPERQIGREINLKPLSTLAGRESLKEKKIISERKVEESKIQNLYQGAINRVLRTEL